MGPPTTIRLLFLLPLAAACGGAVDEGAQSEPPSDGDASDSDASDSDGVPSEGSEGDGTEPGQMTLGECKLGFRSGEEDRPCTWLAEARCYETKVAACDCICPRDVPSLCLSDFPGGEGSETNVTCRAQSDR